MSIYKYQKRHGLSLDSLGIPCSTSNASSFTHSLQLLDSFEDISPVVERLNMSEQRSRKRSLMEESPASSSLKECTSTPYKRRKQTSVALEALGQLIKDSSIDTLDSNNKLNKNDILSLTLARLLRFKYWPSHYPNRNVQLAAGIPSPSITEDLTGFILVLNAAGRIILISDNVEYYLRKHVQSLCLQLTSIYDCVGKEDHDAIRQMLSTPSVDEKHAICTWILPRGKRPNRSPLETKSMLLTGHFFFLEDDQSKEPLFVARCEQILSSVPTMPSTSIGSTSTTTLRFVLTEQLNISEISTNTQCILGYHLHELIDQSIHRILPSECLDLVEQAKQTCFSGDHFTSMHVLDLFTRNGDRLTFLCNIHMLIEGRRQTMKLSFLAQLIDPLIRYECLIYANQQNLERQKTSVQQEPMFMPNIPYHNLTSTATTTPPSNVVMPPHDQCLSMSYTPKYNGEQEYWQYNVFNQRQQIAQVPFENNQDFFSSPTQELGHQDELFNWLDEENNKPNNEYSSPIDAFYDGFNMHEFGFFTPAMSAVNFF